MTFLFCPKTWDLTELDPLTFHDFPTAFSHRLAHRTGAAREQSTAPRFHSEFGLTKNFRKRYTQPNELWRYENIWGNISLIIPDLGNVLLTSEKYSLAKQLCSLSYLSLLIQRDFEITLVMYFHRWNSLKRKINILKEWYYQSLPEWCTGNLVRLTSTYWETLLWDIW